MPAQAKTFILASSWQFRSKLRNSPTPHRPGGEAQVAGATTGLTLRTCNCTEVSFSSPGPFSNPPEGGAARTWTSHSAKTQAHGVAAPGVFSRYAVTGTAFRGGSHGFRRHDRRDSIPDPDSRGFPGNSEPSPHPPKRKRIAPRMTRPDTTRSRRDDSE